jgi:hypothetical protein
MAFDFSTPEGSLALHTKAVTGGKQQSFGGGGLRSHVDKYSFAIARGETQSCGRMGISTVLRLQGETTVMRSAGGRPVKPWHLTHSDASRMRYSVLVI